MNIFGMVKHASGVLHAIGTGDAGLLGSSAVRVGLSAIPGGNLLLGSTVDRAFGVSAAVRGEVFNTELQLHRRAWRAEVDSIGDHDGQAEWEDIGHAVTGFVEDTVDKVGGIVDFLGDLF